MMSIWTFKQPTNRYSNVFLRLHTSDLTTAKHFIIGFFHSPKYYLRSQEFKIHGPDVPMSNVWKLLPNYVEDFLSSFLYLADICQTSGNRGRLKVWKMIIMQCWFKNSTVSNLGRFPMQIDCRVNEWKQMKSNCHFVKDQLPVPICHHEHLLGQLQSKH